jgi:hypothetical protein
VLQVKCVMRTAFYVLEELSCHVRHGALVLAHGLQPPACLLSMSV